MKSETLEAIGPELRNIRQNLGFKLRDIERIAGISNAYLSQLETGKIHKPSPDILFKLAQVYQINYGNLMAKAGYLSAPVMTTESRQPKTVEGAALFGSILSAEEERGLWLYLTLILRHKKKQEAENV